MVSFECGACAASFSFSQDRFRHRKEKHSFFNHGEGRCAVCFRNYNGLFEFFDHFITAHEQKYKSIIRAERRRFGDTFKTAPAVLICDHFLDSGSRGEVMYSSIRQKSGKTIPISAGRDGQQTLRSGKIEETIKSSEACSKSSLGAEIPAQPLEGSAKTQQPTNDAGAMDARCAASDTSSLRISFGLDCIAAAVKFQEHANSPDTSPVHSSTSSTSKGHAEVVGIKVPPLRLRLARTSGDHPNIVTGTGSKQLFQMQSVVPDSPSSLSSSSGAQLQIKPEQQPRASQQQKLAGAPPHAPSSLAPTAAQDAQLQYQLQMLQKVKHSMARIEANIMERLQQQQPQQQPQQHEYLQQPMHQLKLQLQHLQQQSKQLQQQTSHQQQLQQPSQLQPKSPPGSTITNSSSVTISASNDVSQQLQAVEDDEVQLVRVVIKKRAVVSADAEPTTHSDEEDVYWGDPDIGFWSGKTTDKCPRCSFTNKNALAKRRHFIKMHYSNYFKKYTPRQPDDRLRDLERFIGIHLGAKQDVRFCEHCDVPQKSRLDMLMHLKLCNHRVFDEFVAGYTLLRLECARSPDPAVDHLIKMVNKAINNN